MNAEERVDNAPVGLLDKSIPTPQPPPLTDDRIRSRPISDPSPSIPDFHPKLLLNVSITAAVGSVTFSGGSRPEKIPESAAPFRVGLMAGAMLIWNGLVFRTAFVRLSNALELIGSGLVLISVFGLVAILSQLSQPWSSILWACGSLCLVPHLVWFLRFFWFLKTRLRKHSAEFIDGGGRGGLGGDTGAGALGRSGLGGRNSAEESAEVVDVEAPAGDVVNSGAGGGLGGRNTGGVGEGDGGGGGNSAEGGTTGASVCCFCQSTLQRAYPFIGQIRNLFITKNEQNKAAPAARKTIILSKSGPQITMKNCCKTNQQPPRSSAALSQQQTNTQQETRDRAFCATIQANQQLPLSAPHQHQQTSIQKPRKKHREGRRAETQQARALR